MALQTTMHLHKSKNLLILNSSHKCYCILLIILHRFLNNPLQATVSPDSSVSLHLIFEPPCKGEHVQTTDEAAHCQVKDPTWCTALWPCPQECKHSWIQTSQNSVYCR